MRNATWLMIVIFLLAVIGVLGWIIMKQSVGPAQSATSTTQAKSASATHPTTTPPTSKPAPAAPLHERVSVSEPVVGATVGDTFTVSGKAPGNWYFEATFPIQVRDEQDNVIGRGHANAQGNWMTTSLVAYTATITIDGGYKGPAVLILLRDNPSGLPENDDSLSVPIAIK